MWDVTVDGRHLLMGMTKSDMPFGKFNLMVVRMAWIQWKVGSWKPERNTVYIRCKTSLEEIMGMERNGEI